MKQLYIIPIIHSEEELGSQVELIKKEYIKKFGLAGWKQHKSAIKRFWTEIEKKIMLLDLDFKNLLIFQDGYPTGMNVDKMISSMVEQHSPNYKIIEKLFHKGAVLIGTESPDLLKKEVEHLKSIEKISQNDSDILLKKRDQFIAQQIEKTLQTGKTGLLFIGAKHKVSDYLTKPIHVTYIHC